MSETNRLRPLPSVPAAADPRAGRVERPGVHYQQEHPDDHPPAHHGAVFLPYLGPGTSIRPRPFQPVITTTLIAADVVAFGQRHRDSDIQLHIRRRLYQALGEAFAIGRLPWWDCHREDRGDGTLLVAPPDTPSHHFLDPFAHHLHAVLRRDNKLASPTAKLQIRLAVHTGQIMYDAYGVAGQPLVHLFRLLNADAFKRALADADADLGVIISDRLYTDTLGHGGLTNPAAYRSLRVTAKETQTTGWTWFPPSSRS
ncbi:hypothetical protein ACFY4C_41770 [Actinomadura viridis]|uniref:hypothetical protein n=1 Tax=Actinomadura viridis TaxID=58110 RepID=UPI0036B9E5D0